MENHFWRIKILNYITNDLVNFAAQKLGPQFFEYIDMTCGAIPEGPFEKVIDVNAPEQFLNLYTDIALNRFMLCTQKLIELDHSYFKLIADYLFNQGKLLELPEPSSKQEAEGLIKLCILQKDSKTDERYWNLMQYFAKGVLVKSKFDFKFAEGRGVVVRRLEGDAESSSA